VESIEAAATYCNSPVFSGFFIIFLLKRWIKNSHRGSHHFLKLSFLREECGGLGVEEQPAVGVILED